MLTISALYKVIIGVSSQNLLMAIELIISQSQFFGFRIARSFFRSVTGTIVPLYSNFQPVKYLSEASELLGDVAHLCCINRLFNQSLGTYQPVTAKYLCLSRKMNSGRTFYLPTNHRPTTSILRLSE